MKSKNTFFVVGLLLLSISGFTGFRPLLFIAFAPMLLLIDDISNGKKWVLKSYVVSFVSLFIWTACSMDWLLEINSRILLGCGVYASVFSIPLIFFRRREFVWRCSMLILVWLTGEYIFSTGELAFPYFVLGNQLGQLRPLVQWYEFTGVIGGTIWILAVNLTIVYLCKSKRKQIVLAYLSAIILIPIAISICIERFLVAIENDDNVEIGLFHTNFNTYTYKYRVQPEQLLQDYEAYLAKGLVFKKDKRLVIWPETAITGFLDYTNWKADSLVQNISKNVLTKYNIEILSGILFRERIRSRDEMNRRSAYLHRDDLSQEWYVNYNAAIFLNPKMEGSTRTKQKLVPFEETVPYPDVMASLSKLNRSLGNFNFTKRENGSVNFDLLNGRVKIAPIICYESLFSSFVSDFVFDKANVIAVMLNESWYSQNNLKGAKAFADFSVLRAIENRRAVVRASNGGISCFIDQAGKITQEIKGPTELRIAKVGLNNRITFYTQYNRLIWQFVPFLSLATLVAFVFKKYLVIKKRRA